MFQAWSIVVLGGFLLVLFYLFDEVGAFTTFVLALVGLFIFGYVKASKGKTDPSGKPVEKLRQPSSSHTKAVSIGRAQPQSTRSARWIPPGSTVKVAGRDIDGMIYLGRAPESDGGWREGNAIVDPGLRVSRAESDLAGESMSYWPSYTHINPQARATYLDWLASGRSDDRIGAGYVFLYFYGLERRFFIDNPGEEEQNLLVAETERLAGIYGGNHSIRRYLGTFLETARIILDPGGDKELQPHFERTSYELPLDMRVAIGRMLEQQLPLSAEWLLSWYMLHPETSVRTPMIRAFPECRALFNVIFNDRFPKGLRIGKPKRVIRAQYRSASGGFEVDLTSVLGDVPDISGLSKPRRIANEIVDEATNTLDKYSRFLGRNPQGRDTIEGHALLPEQLWPLFPCGEMEELRGWAEEVMEGDGFTGIDRVIEQLEGSRPEKTSKRQLIGAADALARLSIGMAPDPRFALRSPRLGEPVVLFPLPGGITALEEVSDGYKELLVSIAMGSFVAHADGSIAARERITLEAWIEAAQLPEAERVRLHANLKWMLSVAPDLGLLRRRLKDASEDSRQALGKIALSMAAVDGVIDPGEINAIEKLYKAIGLPTDDIYSSLHAHTARSEPVTVRTADTRAPEFAIPEPTQRKGTLVLDAERVASLKADTARVSSVLGNIFGDDEEDEEIEEQREVTGGLFPGLDARLSAFLDELVTQQHWEEADFKTLAGRFRLMQAGALESLNEWSFERFGDALIEEYEGYDLNPDVLAQLQN